MGFLGKAVRVLTRGSEAKAFGFVADLAWEMFRAQKTNLSGDEKRDIVLRWFEKVFNGVFGAKYEELRAAVIELIASAKNVVKLVKAIN